MFANLIGWGWNVIMVLVCISHMIKKEVSFQMSMDHMNFLLKQILKMFDLSVS